jgi:Subtilase family/PA domain
MKTPDWFNRNRFGSIVRITSVGTLMSAAAAMAFFAANLSGSAPNAAGLFTANSLTAESTYAAGKSLGRYVAQSDPSLLGRTDSKRINVMIKYDYDPTASYTGTVTGLAATSPSATGKKLKENKGAVNAYERYAAGVSQKITAAVQQAVPEATIRGSFVTVYGGVAAQLPANKVGDLLKVPGVVAVQSDSLEKPLTDVTPQFIGATDVWPSLGGQTNAASNVIVGVIDTGIWPEHPSFVDHGLPAPPGGPYGCEFGDGTDPLLGPAFTCNDKLIGAYAFTNTYMNAIGAVAGEYCNNTTKKCSARDSEGHGTHTSSTAAGDGVASAVLLGVERGPISGMAPGARVIMYRVCLEQGCFTSDSVAAVQQAITDGVDVINFSISGGANPYTDPVELAFLDAFDAGITVNASAGNSGPGAGTAAHGGPWVTTVGASTSNRHFLSTLHLTGDGGATLDLQGVTVTAGISTATDVVLASDPPYSDAICNHVALAGTFTGKVVVCKRGTNARVDKGYNVLQGGAVGYVLYNDSAAVTDLESDNHWLPAIHVQFASNAVAGFVGSHTGVQATWASGTASAVQGDVMASFSSRGPLGWPHSHAHRNHERPARGAVPGDRGHLNV